MTEWGNNFCADPELKKDVYKRLREARKDGLTVGEIERESEGELGVHDVFDMLEAKIMPKEKWLKMDEVLKAFGY